MSITENPNRFNYGEALQKSFLFYEAQRSGQLPENNRIEWRGDSAVDDGNDVGLDLSGGYYDAGDFLKLGLPMASSLTTIAWGIDEYKSGYLASGQLDEALDAIKWGTDFILKSHITDGTQTLGLWAQVGDPKYDHQHWGSPEDMDIERPSFKIDRDNPGSDLAGESAAALASAAIIYKDIDPEYSQTLLDNSIQLFQFAETYQGKYSDSIIDGLTRYQETEDDQNLSEEELNAKKKQNAIYLSSRYEDELAWGALWLYKATGNIEYLEKAESYSENTYLGNYTQIWDDKTYGVKVLLSQETDNPRYRNEVEKWLDLWIDGKNGVFKTDGGLSWRTGWGSLRLTANTAFLAGIYSDTVNDDNGRYSDFVASQINYILGDNPLNFSYQIGFGDNYALRPHHRSSHGSTWTTHLNEEPNPHILYGALVGGPKSNDDYDYQDLRTDWIGNEVALDYNAGFTGALAYMYENYGGDPLSDFDLDSLDEIKIDLSQVNYIKNTVNNDRFNGSSAIDLMVGLTGNDIIYALSGNDTIFGLEGEDFLVGGDDNDHLLGGEDNDTLSGQNDNDTLVGDRGLDRLWGGSGEDLLFGGVDNDYLNGGIGNDYLNGGLDNDTLNGHDGDDYLDGNEGSDRLIGGLGNDTINGGDDDDWIVGQQGMDLINGDSGNDTIRGQEDSDVLNGNSGEDFLIGGDGEDTLFGGDDNDRLTGQDGSDDIFGGLGNDTLWGGNDNDYLDGNEGNDRLIGGLGNDTINGGDDDDWIVGQQGMDLINGDSGNDTIRGQEDSDVLNGNSGEDFLIGGDGEDTLFGGDDNDRLTGQDGNDNILGGLGNDTLWGNNDNDSLDGNEGNDRLVGGDGNDVLIGYLNSEDLSEIDNDTLIGQDGNDTLSSGQGIDILYGQNDNDILIAKGINLNGEIDSPDLFYGGLGEDNFDLTEYGNFLLNNSSENPTFDLVTIKDFNLVEDSIVLAQDLTENLSYQTIEMENSTGIVMISSEDLSNEYFIAVIEKIDKTTFDDSANIIEFNYN